MQTDIPEWRTTSVERQSTTQKRGRERHKAAAQTMSLGETEKRLNENVRVVVKWKQRERLSGEVNSEIKVVKP